MVTSIHYDPIDYDCIDKVVDIRITLMNSRLVEFEVYYRRKEGTYQTHAIPTHSAQVDRMLAKLREKGLIVEAEFCKLHKDLRSLDSTVSGTYRFQSIAY